MPTFDTVRVNNLDEETTLWFSNLLTVIETLDAHAYTQLMTEDVVLQLSDGTVLEGRTAVENSLAASWVPVKTLIHREKNIYGTSTHFAHETEVEMSTHDGQIFTTVTTSWIDRADNGLLRSARLYG